jgi:type VI protein secretion system component VasK
MIAVALSFFAAVKAGDLWARAAIVGLILAGLLAFASWQVWRIYDAGGDARQAKIEQQEKANAQAAKGELDRVNGGDTSRVRGFDRD